MLKMSMQLSRFQRLMHLACYVCHGKTAAKSGQLTSISCFAEMYHCFTSNMEIHNSYQMLWISCFCFLDLETVDKFNIKMGI